MLSQPHPSFSYLLPYLDNTFTGIWQSSVTKCRDRTILGWSARPGPKTTFPSYRTFPMQVRRTPCRGHLNWSLKKAFSSTMYQHRSMYVGYPLESRAAPRSCFVKKTGGGHTAVSVVSERQPTLLPVTAPPGSTTLFAFRCLPAEFQTLHRHFSRTVPVVRAAHSAVPGIDYMLYAVSCVVCMYVEV